MSKLLSVVTVLLGVLMLTGATVAQDTANTVTVSPINDHLYMITCLGGEELNLPPYTANIIASVGPDGLLLIDDGFRSTAEELRDTLMRLSPTGKRIIINTHYHGDHVSGNQALRDNAVILAHRNVLNRLSGYYFNLPGPPDPNRPHVGFDDSLVLHFNNETVRVIHAPSCHTDGDVYVYFVESNVVFVGDLVFADATPYVDLGAGGSVKGSIVQVNNFIDEYSDDITFIPAHGRPCTRDDLREYVGMLTGTTEAVRAAIAKGQTVDQMVQSEVLAAYRSWEGNFPTTSLAMWTRTVNTELRDLVNARPSVCDPLTATLVDGTGRDAVDHYHKLKAAAADAYNFSERQINMLGYQLLFRNRVDDAVAVLKLNMEEYPESFNVYDSYGEALMISGDTANAIVNYEKSLELNADNTNATDMLKKLRHEL